MAIRKRNEFLDGDESEEEIDRGYDSDAVEESRVRIGGGSKRRKIEDGDNNDDESGSDEDADESFHSLQDSEENEQSAPKNLALSDIEPTSSTTGRKASGEPTSQIATTPKQFAAAAKAARKSGVLYISRVPPFMKPQTLRHYLTPHASKGLGRIFLTPEDHAAHTKRVRAGGNKKKTFTDGWVEFASKTEAKQCADMLNGNIIGGKKGSFYHDDLWNVKYLHGFKWADLTEQIAAENAERQARLREEVRKTRKENKAFVRDVERGKMMEGMERKKSARPDKEEGDGERKTRKMEFKQKEVKGRREGGGGGTGKQDENVSRVLGKIF
ncbi:Hypothetical protein R9X50_00728200 [Acrodontium crateriforme]|uniref:18S rRNA factor 2 n=1 Tax=Acrodontium crateriforme TaxID=150365 RepID=A0AAQ3MCS5_9PEZI|nr:Hypothetical protein R9X50_00728200 [Acrodontium crateriforme]